ncbi:MAG: hypothetical protein ACPGR4_02200, partial [Paracoccaceae bacterium]
MTIIPHETQLKMVTTGIRPNALDAAPGPIHISVSVSPQRTSRPNDWIKGATVATPWHPSGLVGGEIENIHR